MHSMLYLSTEQFSVVQIISDIAERLEKLHENGYVHRDLRPHNLMWLERRARWAMLDCSCVAPAGLALAGALQFPLLIIENLPVG